MTIMGLQAHENFEPLDKNLFLVRRPVFGALRQVIAYDVVHCGLSVDVDLEACMATRIDVMAAGRMVFVAVARDVLLGLSSLPPATDERHLVMVVAADIHVDDELLAAVNGLVAKGYLIALADFGYGENNNALLPYADFIRLSIEGVGDEALQELLASLHEFRVRLIAEDVDSWDQYERARLLGFDGFMGDFYCQPEGPDVREFPVATVSLLRLAALVQEPELDLVSMEALISQDVVLSYQLLRYINSAAFSLRNKVESIRHAIILLGLDEIRKWSVLVAVLYANEKPEELMWMALWRANMCELLCDESGQGNSGTAFIVGLFSLLGVMFGRRLEDLLAQLPLTDDIKDALLGGRGVYAEVLACVCAYGDESWSKVSFTNLMPGHISAIYLRAMCRADQSMGGLYVADAGMVEQT